MKNIAPRRLSRSVWRQTRPRNGLLDFADPARYDARYHRTSEPGAWYASFTERGAWAEMFRHWGQDEVSPFEVRRRVGRARVADLAVLDMTNQEVCDELGFTKSELVADDWSRTQQLATDARATGFDGILAPSAALDGETTLIVFAHAMHKVESEHSRIRRPPTRMLDVLLRIRLSDAGVERIGRFYEALARLAHRLGRWV